MTIFRKVFDSKKSNSVPDYFERVATPEDIQTNPDTAASCDGATSEAVPRAAMSHPVTADPTPSQPLNSRPIISQPASDRLPSSQPVSSRPATSEPASSRPAFSNPNPSHPAPSQSASSEPLVLQAGPARVSGPIFGIGHSDAPNAPLTDRVPVSVPAPAPDPSFAAEAADAVEQMLTPATSQPTGHGAPSSVPRMLSNPVADATPTPEPASGAPRTRLLGFHRSQPIQQDPLGTLAHEKVHAEELFPAGWVAIIQGPGEGNALPVFSRVCVIGRGEDQDIRLDFGDTSISRDKHAAIAFDDEQCKFYLGHGGKSNLIRLNGRPVLSTEELQHGDTIRIGETTLRFVALCGEDFIWNGSKT